MKSLQVNIYDFIDYREFLRAYYEERHARERIFSHRRISFELEDKSPSFFLKVIRDGRKLKEAQLIKLPHILGLDEAEGEYFKLLYQYGTASNKVQREFWLNQIISKCTSPRRDIGLGAARYYTQWYHSAIRCLLDVIDISNDPQPLTKQLKSKVTLAQAKESLALLAELKLIAKNENGFWKPVDSAIFSRSSIQDGILRSYRLNSLDLGREAILYPDKEWPTQFFTASLSVSNEAWLRILDRIQVFRAEIRNIVRSDNAPLSRVIHLQQAAFPLTEPLKDETNKN